MSINITAADFRKAFYGTSSLDSSLMKSMPLSFKEPYVTYDGTWLQVDPGGAGVFFAIKTGHSLQRCPSNTKANPKLVGHATCKSVTDDTEYMFFFEPHKGGFSEYQGLDCCGGAVHYARSCNNSVVTTTDIDPQDWTVEHDFTIRHEADDSDVYFYVDGVEEAHHTTNVSSQPYEIACCEANGVDQIMYLKYPPGIWIGVTA